MPYSDLVDAEPVRRHVQGLLDAGMSVSQIQHLSGVNRTCIRVLLGVMPGREASRQVRALTASRLLRTKLDRGAAVDGLVPDVGTRRRLQALQAIGWPQPELARRLGTAKVQTGRGYRGLELASTAYKVEALYLELRDTPGPSQRVVTWSQSRGYLAPVWWDDDTIDDPLAVPEGTRTYSAHGNLIDDVMLPRAERVALMSRARLDVDEIATRIGCLRRYVQLERLAQGFTNPRSTGPAAQPSAPSKKQLPCAEELDWLLDEAGESIAAIALRYGVSEGAVTQALRRSTAA